jgi:5-methylcytosine-specific restriction endonuclease McrA
MNKCVDCGKEISKTAERCYSCANKGKNNPAYLGGKDKEKYKGFDNNLRNSILFRDKFKCQICGEKQVMFKTDKLDCHHIDYNKENSVPKNLIALCKKCHIKTNFDREKWIEFFRNLFIKRGIL